MLYKRNYGVLISLINGPKRLQFKLELKLMYSLLIDQLVVWSIDCQEKRTSCYKAQGDAFKCLILCVFVINH